MRSIKAANIVATFLLNHFPLHMTHLEKSGVPHKNSPQTIGTSRVSHMSHVSHLVLCVGEKIVNLTFSQPSQSPFQHELSLNPWYIKVCQLPSFPDKFLDF